MIEEENEKQAEKRDETNCVVKRVDTGPDDEENLV